MRNPYCSASLTRRTASRGAAGLLLLLPVFILAAWGSGRGVSRAGATPPDDLIAANACSCGGAGCRCVSMLCGGTRDCSCRTQARDCRCPTKICNFAGVNYCCTGSHQDNTIQRCNKHCGCNYAKGECKCSVSCNCNRR